MLNRALAAPVFLLAACTVPAPESPPGPRADPPPASSADAVPVAAVMGADPVSNAHAVTAGPTRALFLANCAQCHGEKGDGEGVTQLDRKARSFLDGGFSYGNTKDAILRSITHGIPGTPMPPFEKALSEAQRVELAEYVIAFGPDRIVVDPSESEIVVTDRPVIVRGKLPAIVEGAQEWPRGIAIGTPEGLTFEYRADDVRLVGVRAGRFLNRSDWGERGGTSLEMLGKVVWTGNPTEHLIRFADGSGVGGLIATEVRDGEVSVEYVVRAREAEGSPSVSVVERMSVFACQLGSGFVRRFSLRGSSDRVAASFVTPTESPRTLPWTAVSGVDERDPIWHWSCAWPAAHAAGEFLVVIADRAVEITFDDTAPRVDVRGTEPVQVAVYCVPVPAWTLDRDADAAHVARHLMEAR